MDGEIHLIQEPRFIDGKEETSLLFFILGMVLDNRPVLQ
jgi:hypothetical protein